MASHETRILYLTRKQRYAIAMLGVLLAALLRAALDPFLGADLPLFFFVVPVLAAAWYGGLWPGLFASVLSLLIADYLFISPRGSMFQHEDLLSTQRVLIFAFVGTLISILCDKTRNAVKAHLECLKRFGILVESVPDYAIFTTDPQGRIACWNNGAARITGYGEKEILGHDFSLFCAPEDTLHDVPRHELEIARITGRCEHEGWQTRKDGSRFWASGVIAALRDEAGQLCGFAKVIRDMTQHKLADEVMQRSQRFMQDIIDVSPSLMYIFDIEHRKHVFVSRGAAQALGYVESQVKAPDFVSSVMHPDHWIVFLDHLARLKGLRDGETADFEYRMRHSDGSWRWLHSRDKIFTRNTDGSVREIIGTATDVTERKNSEERNRFMVELDQALEPLAGPDQIITVAMRMLGEHLGVDRASYADVEADEDHLMVLGEFTRDATAHLTGRYSISDFGEKESRALREGRPFVVNDVDTELAEGFNISHYHLAEIRSVVCIPLIKDRHFVARMALHQKTPRNWLKDEIDLITTVANRCWESVERVRTLKRLKESDDRYRAFIRNSSEAIWRYELDEPIPIALPEDEQIELFYQRGYLAECNEAFARAHGRSSVDEIRGERLTVLLVRAEAEKVIEYSRSFVRSGYRLIGAETREVDICGNTKYFLSNLIGIQENGKLVRAWGTQRDISVQKRTEQALRASEERMRRITDATQDALWEIDLRTRQLWWSEGARPLFGHSPGELQIGLSDWYDGIHPEDRERVRAQFENFMAGNAAVDWFDEYRFRRADGVYVYIHDKGRRFCDETGEAVWIAGAMANITERKAAEQALRDSEERYRSLTELSPDGVVIAGADGTIHLANASLLNMLGLGLEEVVGRNLLDFLSPPYLDDCRQCLKTLMADGLPATQVNAGFRSRDARTIPVEVSAVRFDAKGQSFAQVVIRDISARKDAEAEKERLSAEVKSERDRLWQILEQMPIGVGIAEAPLGRALFNNREATRLLRRPLGYAEDYRGYAQFGALYDDGTSYRAEDYPQVRSLLSREVIKGAEMRYRRGDGTETIFSVDSAPIYDPDGRMLLVVATFIDIADRKRTEKDLRESEERFAKAFRASPDALVISRIKDGVILEVNDSFVALSGYDRDQLIGKSTLMLDIYVDPADRGRALEILEERGRVRDIEVAVKRRSGEVRLLQFSAEPLDLHGEHCWLIIGRDITERNQAEKEREQLLLKEKTAREDAEASNRMKDEFLATMSHELRTPLTAILGWARMLTGGTLPESQMHRAFEVIERSAESQARLVDDILDTSRIITGRFNLETKPIQMLRTFEAAVEVVRPSAEAKRITLHAEIQDRDSMIMGDANRVQQIIWNLLSNAVKFTNPEGRIDAQLKRIGDWIVVSIRDTGIGIDSEFLPHVFDRFRQADSTSTRKYGGLGLGLAIVRHLVEVHGGSVSASSPGPGLGSTFRVHFPIAQTSNQERPEGPLPPPEPELLAETESGGLQKLNGLRVLVVEDDSETLEMLKFVLDQCQAETTAALSVNEALQNLEHSRFDVLVSDLAMPERDGYDLIREIRSRTPDRGGNLPAIALSAYTRPQDRAQALAAGFQLHLSKPIDPSDLVNAISTLTGHTDEFRGPNAA
jgi:PAS domain S-box-containing protein